MMRDCWVDGRHGGDQDNVHKISKEEAKRQKSSNFAQICSKVVSTMEPTKIIGNHFIFVKLFVL